MCCALVERGAARDQVNAEVNKAFMHLSVAGKEDQCCVEGKGQQEVMAAWTVAQNKTTLSIFLYTLLLGGLRRKAKHNPSSPHLYRHWEQGTEAVITIFKAADPLHYILLR